MIKNFIYFFKKKVKSSIIKISKVLKIFPDEIQENFEINYEAAEYYQKRMTIDRFKKNINMLFNINNTKLVKEFILKNDLDNIKKNQNISFEFTNINFIDYIVINSKQNGSTPGIIFEIELIENITYYITYYGYISKNTNTCFYCFNELSYIDNKNKNMNIFYSSSQV